MHKTDCKCNIYTSSYNEEHISVYDEKIANGFRQAGMSENYFRHDDCTRNNIVVITYY